MPLRNATRSIPPNERIQVRIGINLGEVIVEGDDRYGEGVNIATRLEQIAEPGGVYVSGKVASEVDKKLSFGFEPMGEQRVKNLNEPIQVFRVTLDGTSKSARRRRRKNWFPRWASAAALATGAVAVGMWLYLGSPEDTLAPSAATGAPSIAVLAFDNMSGDPNLGYFSDGVSEDIISMLARSQDLSVIARNSSFTYKGKPTDVRQIGKDLNVGYVLEGSVRKEADKVRIVAQLINAKTGEHVWAEQFDQTGSDPMAIQDVVTKKIVTALVGDTGSIKRAAYRDAWGKDTANLEEYDYYLRGHDKLLQNTAASMEEARQIWTEGLTKYPDSALLKFKLGFMHYVRAVSGWQTDVKADYKKAGDLAHEGMAEDNLTPLELKLGHWLLAYVYLTEDKYKSALQEAELAISMAPNDAWMVAVLVDAPTASGEIDKAVSWVDFGINNDPANSAYYHFLKGWALMMGERYAKSAEAMKVPDDWTALIPLTKAMNAYHLGRPDEAKAEVRKALELNPSFTTQTWRDTVHLDDRKHIDLQVAALIEVGLPEK